ncbi:MAG TPA: Rv2175c family DNA-binding protein [Dermatophilaceae bacterium]|nr:Rv2175c family DNA-binding protein [Dermatophilaceae bacterium]
MANDNDPDSPADDDLAERAESDELAELEQLVGEWLTVPDIAERLGLRLSDVRQLITDRQILSLRIGPRHVISIPAKFVNEDGLLPELPGTFTVLRDSRMTDTEILRWLFTPDDTLPLPGAPMDALLAGFKTEVRRRAMEAAF